MREAIGTIQGLVGMRTIDEVVKVALEAYFIMYDLPADHKLIVCDVIKAYVMRLEK